MGGVGGGGDGEGGPPFQPEPRNSASPIPKSLKTGFLVSGWVVSGHDGDVDDEVMNDKIGSNNNR